MQFTAKIRKRSTLHRNWRELLVKKGTVHSVLFVLSGHEYVAQDPDAVATNLAALQRDPVIQVEAFSTAREPLRPQPVAARKDAAEEPAPVEAPVEEPVEEPVEAPVDVADAGAVRRGPGRPPKAKR